MLGLFIALIVAAIAGASGKPGPVIYRRTTSFLVWWYIVVGVLALAAWMALIGMGVVLASWLLGPIGSLIVGGASTLLVIVTIGVLALLQVVGSLCLKNALVADSNAQSGYRYRAGVAAIGALLLFIGIWNFSS